MKKLNAIEKSKYINDRYKEYIRSTFKFDDKGIQNLFDKQLDNELLFKGPYVDLILPFERGHSLNYLIDTGVVSKRFRELDDVNLERPLYKHQEESIKLINSGESVVITTGTGSGKTESFLYPIINNIMLEQEKGNNRKGVRAIFLYPMNALVNDQIDRVRKMLKNYPDITFGFFTGETVNDASKNYREKLSEINGVDIPENELVTREEIRNNPPHLLFTNYSMLEYLLIRPTDYDIIKSENLKNWKYVVLDEAHSYYGSKGIELSLLMRRVSALTDKKPQFILTSATLGKQGKSEADIVEFAKNLTSAEFSEKDIVFSKRVGIKEKPKYRITGSDYVKIKEKYNDRVALQSILSKYDIFDESLKTSELLYDALSKDENVHELAYILKDKSDSFNNIYEKLKLDMNREELVALIDIINMSEKDGMALFDLKYHSFIRSLSGAYVSFGDEKKLSLTKTNEIEGMKAFELGNCRFCNSPYIIGKLVTSEATGLQYLIQNKEIDIYENYGEEEFARIDYFTLTDIKDEEQEEGKVDTEPYTICAKCGVAYSSENLNAKKCECGDKYAFKVYRVRQDTNNDEIESIYNNIPICPCCGRRSATGVVKGLNVGKDEGTALVAQTLYEAIDEGEDNNTTKIKKLSLKKSISKPEENDNRKVKQYLVFSDSRQQASFAAVFFESNHVRMLRKRLIWEAIEKNNYRDISVNELVSILEDRIRRSYLFPKQEGLLANMDSSKNAWAAVLVDLLKVDGNYDGEGLGLYYFDLNIRDILENNMDEGELEEVFPNCGMTMEKLYTLMQIVLEVFKVSSSINIVQSGLSKDERKEILEYRRFNNYVMLQKSPSKGKKETKELANIKSFLPVTGESNSIVRYVMKTFNVDSNKAKDILEKVFGLLCDIDKLSEGDDFLTKNDKHEAYEINANKYIVKNYKNSKFYRCNKCGKITPYNINDSCPQDKCNGKLVEIDPDEALKNNYYRYQYKNKKIESIVIKEHTAQIERKTAKEYQNDFKNKKINILSCSTTFEMGIDIGDLETVFMRNVPPTPANYVQRAGRAGRRKDSSAYILTYCGVASHDYTYFTEPEKMISGVISPPSFNVVNKKIIKRHLMAASLGFFFRAHPEFFKSIDAFVISGDGVNKFKEYLNEHPADLNEYINKMLPESLYDEYRNYKWVDSNNGDDEKLTYFVDKILDTLKQLENAKEIAKQKLDEDDVQAGKDWSYYTKQIEAIKKESVINMLSRYSVIPKYGFPVDLVDLQVYKDGRLDPNISLSRDLKIAISEYAPDSEVIVDGNKYTSKYITLDRNSEFAKHWFVTCSNLDCRKVNIFMNQYDIDTCKYCGESIKNTKADFYIEPKNGFKTGLTKESSRMKPKRSYAGDVIYVGNGKKDETNLVLDEILGIETSSEDELLVMNKNYFYMCPKCGYSEIDKHLTFTPKIQVNHSSYSNYKCDNDELERIRIGHKFQTDVARITIPMLTLAEKHGYNKALSFMFAFLEGISLALEIERTDIDGVLEENLVFGSYDILIYDNVPGGAGHIKRLMNKTAIVRSLEEALNKVSQNCCDENTSCYNCLRNYYNQKYHDKLRRRHAIEVIYLLLPEIKKAKAEFRKEGIRR